MRRLLAIKNLNNDSIKIFNILARLMKHVEDLFSKKIISNNIYNTTLSELFSITDTYTTFFSIKNDTVLSRRKYLNEIISNLADIVKNIGASNLEDLIYINFQKTERQPYLDSFNKIFIPTKSEVKHYDKIQGSRVYGEIKLNKIFNTDSFMLNMNGGTLKIPIKSLNKYLVVEGFFIKDSLNIYRKEFLPKINDIENMISHNREFITGYIKQLSLRDFLLYSNNDILSICDQKIQKIKKYKETTISSIVKEFLNMKVEEQIEFLTIFLLLKSDNESQYMAYLLYDMISNESFLLKPQPLAEQVYNNLHWSIQKLFKVALKKIEQITSQIDFDEDSLSYEKRIMLLKTNDYVKNKAIEKLKEIKQKSGDNVSKAQQYLDGLLMIPFGVYRTEDIMNFKGKFRDNLKEFLDTNEIPYGTNTFTVIEIEKLLIELTKDYNFKLNYTYLNKNYKINSLKEILCSVAGDDSLKEKSLRKKEIIDKLLDIFSKRENDNCISVLSKHEQISLKLSKYNTDWANFKKDSKDYIHGVQEILDSAVYGQDEAKKEIKRIIAQWINGSMNGYVFGFEGPPGTGKTSLAKKGISKCLENRPFAFIALGGSANGSTFEGHSYTYVGSTWGKIVDILRETKCMNPIIYIDELDKISNTENGREIIGILTHLTDPSQNDEFQDKYFSGIKIDLSKVLFIFSYNDFSKIDPILADRIHRVHFRNLNKKDKKHIIHNYLMPEFLFNVGLPEGSLIFSEKTLDHIIDNYTNEAGIRKLKQKIFEIVREINLRTLTNQTNYNFPLEIPMSLVEEVFHNNNKIINQRISVQCHVGLVNGLYATVSGMGGITIIEAFKTPSDSKLNLMLTGQQGNVMKESVSCAKTISWNVLPPKIKKKIVSELKDNPWGIHIHCPEASVPKDGPSAGGAMTIAMISLFTGIPVLNTVAVTGEIDLNGKIHMIGGLENKIEGGKKAGVKTICYPVDNNQDIEKIRKKHPELLENINLKPISNIWELVDETLVDKINLVRY